MNVRMRFKLMHSLHIQTNMRVTLIQIGWKIEPLESRVNIAVFPRKKINI